MAGCRRIGFENRYIRKDGCYVHIMWSALWAEKDQLRIGVARDVTERKRAEERQAATYAVSEAAQNATDLAALFPEIQRIVARLVPLAGFAVAVCDPKTKRIAIPYQMNLYGASSFEVDALAQLHCEDVIRGGQPLLLSGDAACSDNGASWLMTPLVTQKETIGALVLKSHAGTVYSDRDKELLQFVSAQVATAMERARLHAELLHAARYDELTGLPNRRLFQDRMNSALARCRRKQGSLAVLYVDIDDFKQVNDSFGHSAGDQLLQEFARRLRHCVREADTVARLGGDEFVVLLEDVQLPEDVSAVADKIHDTVSQRITIDGGVLRIQTSIGFALYPEHGLEPEELLKHADKAMYLGKKGKDCTQE
jgi:diguanylate cyclase (GGDEF)-like protein